MGTEDERPLGAADFDELRRSFERVELSYPNLYLFEALGRALGHRGILPARRLDSLLWRRVPALWPHSYHVLVELLR